MERKKPYYYKKLKIQIKMKKKLQKALLQKRIKNSKKGQNNYSKIIIILANKNKQKRK